MEYYTTVLTKFNNLIAYEKIFIYLLVFHHYFLLPPPIHYYFYTSLDVDDFQMIHNHQQKTRFRSLTDHLCCIVVKEIKLFNLHYFASSSKEEEKKKKRMIIRSSNFFLPVFSTFSLPI